MHPDYKNKLRVTPETLQLEQAEDGTFVGQAIADVAEGIEVRCSAGQDLQVEPSLCGPGSTTLRLKAAGDFSRGVLEFKAKRKIICKIDVVTNVRPQSDELPRRELSNEFALPLSPGPATSVKYASVVVAGHDVVMLHIHPDSLQSGAALQGHIDVFSIKTWTWNRTKFHLKPPTSTRVKKRPTSTSVVKGPTSTRKKKPRLPSVLGRLCDSAVVFAFSGGDGRFHHRAIEFQPATDGSKIHYRELRNPLQKSGAIPAAGTRLVDLAPRLQLRLDDLCVTSSIRTHCLSSENSRCESDTSKNIQYLCTLLWQKIVRPPIKNGEGSDSAEPSTSEEGGTHVTDQLSNRICEELRKQGRLALPHIADLLRPSRSMGPANRWNAVQLVALEMLAQSRDPEVLNDILWAAYDPSSNLRLAAAQHLRHFPVSLTGEIHISLLSHIDPAIRLSSVAALKSEVQKNPGVQTALLENAVRFADTADAFLSAALP